MKICYCHTFGVTKLLMNLHHPWIHKYKHFQNRKDSWSLSMPFHLTQGIDFTFVEQELSALCLRWEWRIPCIPGQDYLISSYENLHHLY